MPNDDILTGLLSEVGPLLEEADIFAYPNAGVYQIVLEEDTSIILQRDAARDVLVFQGDLGTPPEGSEPRLYPLLLAVNEIWDSTGGLRFSVDWNDREVVMLWDVSAETLDAQKLHAALSSFAERMILWREVVEGGGVKEEQSYQPTGQPGGDVIVG